MPELPEVETIRRQLEPALAGRRIVSAEVRDRRFCRGQSPRGLERTLAGRSVESVERRGKYLVFRFDGAITMLLHLRMTGNLVLASGAGDEIPAGASGGARAGPNGRVMPPSLRPEHLRATFHLDSGGELQFFDARRFGHGLVLASAEADRHLEGRLGVEPLSPGFTADALAELAAHRRAPLKSFLLTQDRIAGVGNIYADEALHHARLHPLSPAGSMRREHCEALRAGVVFALERGLAHGGASIDDYLDLRGESGSMQDEFLVHRNQGRPCPRCGTPISRIVIGGRSTYFCSGCQKRLRRRRRRRPGP